MIDKKVIFADLLTLDLITVVRSQGFTVTNAFIEVCQPNPLRQALYFISDNLPTAIQLSANSIFGLPGSAAWVMQNNELRFHRDKDFKMVTDGWQAISFNGPTLLAVFESLYTG